MKAPCYALIAVCAYIVDWEYARVSNTIHLSTQLTKCINHSDDSSCQMLTTQMHQVASFFHPTLASLQILALYFAWLYLLTFVTPGYKFHGPPLRDGRQLTFYINGLPILALTIAAFIGLVWNGLISSTIAYDNFGGLFAWCNIVAFTVSLYLFIRGRMRGLSNKNLWEDFVMGQELVPIVAGLQLNFFWLRPSMMAWLFLNIGFLARHWQVNDGHVSTSMLMYQLFTNAYVVDYFIFEEFVTSTWDIIAEKFGYMLVWGDLVFIPFTFTIQAWFLVDSYNDLSLLEAVSYSALFILGYSIFRFANKQKHDFKKNPKALVWGKPAKTIGKGKLLISGWWGIASHVNYLGDLLLAVAYVAPCGLFRSGSFLPWFYPFYLLILLIHRDWRDDSKCAKKYGELWLEYRKHVPYHILPGVY